MDDFEGVLVQFVKMDRLMGVHAFANFVVIRVFLLHPLASDG
jgi:hypothetical protein